MRTLRAWLVKAVACAALFGGAQVLGAQELVIQRADGTEARVTAADIAKLPHARFEALDHGRTTRLEGVPLREVLLWAAAGPVDSLRGPLLRRVIVAHGADGYRALVALAEVDRSIGAREVYVVTAADGVPLEPAMGPYRLLVVGDGRASRWVRQLVRLEMRDVP
jgi:DMSO/TMAO reductase YedYZ molybdopterin-dependent catalytic subunit